MKKAELKKIEEFVKKEMNGQVAHDFNHVSRVRNWALLIAKKEKYGDMASVEAAALLHDIGLTTCEKRSAHGEVGAEITENYLKKLKIFDANQICEIVNAVKFHNKNRFGSGELLSIIRDADILDLLGAVGIMRAYMSKNNLPEYDKINIKGKAWNKGADYFDKNFDKGIDVKKFISDQINFQISCFDNLKTDTAKKFAKPLIKYMKNFLNQLETEIKHTF